MGRELKRLALDVAAEALQLDRAERPEFLDRACLDNPMLRTEVDSILAHEESGRHRFPTHHVDDDPLSRPGPLVPGDRLGAYRIERLLAQGGMGAVYEATRDDGAFDKSVAIKVMRWSGGNTEQLLEKFVRERQVLAGLEHPGITRLIDGGTTSSDWPYLVMELVHGKPIDRHCADKDLDLNDRLELVEQVCRAVEHAHQMGVVHRDLKPSNILVTKDGTPKLLDFGIARLFSPDDVEAIGPAAQTTAGWFTLEYASPEQIRGDQIGPASDIYSLGVVLYELLTGRRPHESRGRSLQGLASAILDHPPIPPSRAAPAHPGPDAVTNEDHPRTMAVDPARLNGPLDDVVLKALRKAPENRYASAGDLGNDLAAIRTGRPVSARPEGLPARLRRAIRRRKILSASLVIAAVSALTIAAAILVLQSRVDRSTARELAALATSALDAGNDANGVAYSVAALRLDRDLRVTSNQLLDVLRQPEILSFGPAAEITTAQFSPDGRLILTSSIDGSIELWEARTGECVGSGINAGGTVIAASFWSSSRQIVVALRDGTVQRWNTFPAASNQPEILQEEGELLSSAVFSPDGRYLVSAEWNGTVRVRDLARGSDPSRPLQHEKRVNVAALSSNGKYVVTISKGNASLWGPLDNPGLPIKPTPLIGHSIFNRSTITDAEHARFSPDGSLVYTTSGDGVARVWDVDSFECLKEIPLALEETTGLDINAGGDLVVTSFANGTLSVWDSQTGIVANEPAFFPGPATTTAISPDGSLALVVDDFNVVRVFRTEPARWVRPPIRRMGGITSIEYSPDGTRLAISNNKGEATIWDVESGAAVGTPMPHQDSDVSITFSPNGEILLSASADGTAQLWDAHNGDPLLSPPLQHDNPIDFATFAPDGRCFATASGYETFLWDTESGELIVGPLAQGDFIESIAFSPDGSMLATSSHDSRVRVWDVQTGNLKVPPLFHGEDVWVNSVAFSSDGTLLATGANDGAIRLWSTGTFEPARQPLWNPSAVYSLHFWPSDRALVASCSTGIHLWDIQSGREILDHPIRHGPATDGMYTLNPDGRSIATSDSGGLALVWNGNEHMWRYRPFSHAPPITGLSFSPKGHSVAIATANGNVFQWDTSSAPLPLDWILDAAEAAVGLRVAPDGSLKSTEDRHEIIARAMSEATRGSTDDPWVRWVLWRFAQPSTKDDDLRD